MVSEADIAAARELCPEAQLRYVPNVVDVAAIAPVAPRSASGARSSSPTSPTSPTATACASCSRRSSRGCGRELPDARLALVGAGLEQPPSDDPRVEALGFVEDLARRLRDARRCAVVPLLQGGGTPLKFVEALAYGLPVIATPRAAAGLDVRDGEHCLLAEGAEAFAAALVARAARRRARARPQRARARRGALLDRGAHARCSHERSPGGGAPACVVRSWLLGVAQRRSPASSASSPSCAPNSTVKRASTPVKLAVVSIASSPRSRTATPGRRRAAAARGCAATPARRASCSRPACPTIGEQPEDRRASARTTARRSARTGALLRVRPTAVCTSPPTGSSLPSPVIGCSPIAPSTFARSSRR